MRSIEATRAAARTEMPSSTRPLTAPIYQNSVLGIESSERLDHIVDDIEQTLVAG